MRSVVLQALAALLLGTAVAGTGVQAEDAKPAGAVLADSLNPNDKSAEPDEKLLKKDAAVKVEDGKYFDADGHPTFHVTDRARRSIGTPIPATAATMPSATSATAPTAWARPTRPPSTIR